MNTKVNPVVLDSEQKQLIENFLRPLCELPCFDELREVGKKRLPISEGARIAIRDALKAFLRTRPDIRVKDALKPASYKFLEELYGKDPGYARAPNGSLFHLEDEWRKHYHALFVKWLEQAGIPLGFEFESLPKKILIYYSIETYGQMSLRELDFDDNLSLALLREKLTDNGVETLLDLVLMPVSKLHATMVQTAYGDIDRMYDELRDFVSRYHLKLGMR